LKNKETNLVRGGLQRSQFKETSEALFLNSGFVYDSAEQAEAIFKGEETGYQYSRYANPTIDTFEKRLALLDGYEDCFATASGMSAVFGSMMCQLRTGDHVISASALFGSCRYILKEILPKFGIEVDFIDGRDLEQWKNKIKKNTKIFFLETPSNPCCEIIDLKGVCDLAKDNNILTIVDNIFATPVLQSPIKYGADIVVYSGTKHIDGQGRVLGGAILTSKQFKEETLKPFLRHTGPCISPFNAWILLKSLETIQLRVNSQSDNAFEIAKFLESNSNIEKVNYPFLESFKQNDLARIFMSKGGTIMSFKIKGDKEKTYKFINNLKIFDITNNIGDTKSLVTHPATTTHRVLSEEERANLDITDNLVRISIGLENIEDLKQDLDQSLSKS